MSSADRTSNVIAGISAAISLFALAASGAAVYYARESARAAAQQTQLLLDQDDTRLAVTAWTEEPHDGLGKSILHISVENRGGPVFVNTLGFMTRADDKALGRKRNLLYTTLVVDQQISLPKRLDRRDGFIVDVSLQQIKRVENADLFDDFGVMLSSGTIISCSNPDEIRRFAKRAFADSADTQQRR